MLINLGPMGENDVESGMLQPSLVWMYENTEGFGSDRFCGILVGGECGDAATLNNWTVSIPDSKPPVETPQMPPEVRVVKK